MKPHIFDAVFSQKQLVFRANWSYIFKACILPMASMIGDEASTRFSTCVSVAEVPPTVAKYRIAYLALTVFPAPDSPDTIMDWLRFSLTIGEGTYLKHFSKLITINN